MPSRTLYFILQDVASRQGDIPALHQPEGSGHRTYSWTEYLKAAEEIAAGLHSLGVVKGDVVALASESRAEFYLADLGILSCGAIAAALYTAYPVAEMVRTIKACGAVVLFAETPQMLEKLAGAPGFPPEVRCFTLSGRSELGESLDALRERGRRAIEKDGSLLARITSDVQPEDGAILYLTSGATGEPKMALVSHDSLISNLEMGPKVLDCSPADSMLAFLPPAHITQRLVVELLPLYCAVPVWFAESLLKLPQEMARVKPTVFVAPPRLWERIHNTIRAELRKRPALLQRWFQNMAALGLEAVRARQAGRKLSMTDRMRLRVADKLLFRQLRARFGGRLKVCASGSAPLGKELAEFLLGIGFPIVEGYGLTEGGVIIMNRVGEMRPGSIGRAMPGVELRIAEDGELLVRSASVFSGYFKDPRATAAVLKDGWLHTGDIAEIDADGFVWITGRKKELIVLSNGKKIYPARVETLFRMEPAVSQVLLVGDGKPFITALITAAEGATAADVKEAVGRVNSRLASFEQIRRFEVLERDFSIDDGELTATLKVRRSRALEHFRDRAERMYARAE